jgi:hypothetical protein
VQSGDPAGEVTMLGYDICVFRQPDGGRQPATVETPCGERLAVWTVGLFDAWDWVKEVVEERKAIDLTGRAFMQRLTATQAQLWPSMRFIPAFAGVRRCDEDEWLIVEVWDAS